MILRSQIIQIFALSQQTRLYQHPLLLKRCKCRAYATLFSTVITRGTVVWRVPSTRRKNRATASASRGGSRHAVQGGPSSMRRPAEIMPLLFDFDVRLAD